MKIQTNDCFIKIGQYQYNSNNIIGKGTVGNVYAGQHKSEKRQVAIKVIKWNKNDNINNILLENQIKALSILNHPNVLKMQNIIKDDEGCYIITEKCKGGTLKQLIQKQGCLQSQLALNIFKGILKGYLSIAQSGILHRDLKPANIMLRQNLEPVIIDFGYCEIIVAKKTMTTFNVGSPSYMSPQAYEKTLYSEKSDIWALGMTLYQMVKGTTMDNAQNIKQFYSKIKKNGCDFSNERFSPLICEIIDRTITYNAQNRISSHKIKYLIDKDQISKLKNKNNRNIKSDKQLNFKIQQSKYQRQNIQNKRNKLQNQYNRYEQKKQIKKQFEKSKINHCYKNHIENYTLSPTSIKFINNHQNIRASSQFKYVAPITNNQGIINNKNTHSQINNIQNKILPTTIINNYHSFNKQIIKKPNLVRKVISTQHNQSNRPFIKFNAIPPIKQNNSYQTIAPRILTQCSTPNPRFSDYKFFNNNFQFQKIPLQVPLKNLNIKIM